MKRSSPYLDLKANSVMNIEFIEAKVNEIIKELEKEVMEVLMDEKLGKGDTNLRIKPLSSTKQILENALDSIKMVDKLNREDLEK